MGGTVCGASWKRNSADAQLTISVTVCHGCAYECSIRRFLWNFICKTLKLFDPRGNAIFVAI